MGAGSYMMENLTEQVYQEARRIVEEVESMGGMAKAVASGWPKLKIEECAAKRQAVIDNGREVIVGVNKYRLEQEEPFEVLSIDNEEVRGKQITRLNEIHANRNEEAAQQKLAAIKQLAAREPQAGENSDINKNLLGLAVEAAKARCTVGEITQAMEEV